LNIHNQCQDISLASPVYFVHGGKWHVVPGQKIDVNAVMMNRIETNFRQDMLEGALVYKIQRQYVKSDKSTQDESKHTQLLIAWHVDHTKRLNVRSVLVEHDGELDRDELKQLHQKCWQSLNAWINPIRSSWLLDGEAVSIMTIKITNRGYRQDIFISEGTGDGFKRPLQIDAER
jgi:hypothetical protein